MYLVSVEMLARSLAIHAGEHDGVPRAILELIDDGRYEHAHDALRAWAHRPMTDYILLDVIYRRIHEALNHGKRLPGWRPILDSWPGRREEEDYVCLPSLPPLPAHWTIERGQSGIIAVITPTGRWTLAGPQYGEDQNKGSCERCQTYTHLEEIPFHGYSLFLCNKCAAAAYREGEAI